MLRAAVIVLLIALLPSPHPVHIVSKDSVTPAPMTEPASPADVRAGIDESKKTAKLTVDPHPSPYRQPTEQELLASSDASRLDEARRVAEILAQANRRVSSGDVIGARDLLAAAKDGAQGPVTFALAETYDPNMLAVWFSRGVSSVVVRARMLYRKALELGVTKANTRLEGLK